MIKTSELMLGNWVYESERTQFPMRVEAIFAEDVYLDFPGNEGDVWEAEESDIMPIPLTEEIVSTLENVECHNDMYLIFVGEHMIRIEKHGESWLFYKFKENNSPEKVCKIVKYVHELQNLCKMCGIELKIEL